jgi:plasmid stability protein
VGQVLIRNIPDETIAAYKERARRKGHSLEQEMRDLIERNKPYTPEERAEVLREIRSQTKGSSPGLSLDEIRDGLE